MRFRLTKKSTGQILTTFHVLDSAGDICGSINVPNEQANDLLRCWQGQVVGDSPHGTSPVNALAAAFLKNRNRAPLSKAAILRGCL